jgi:hypothetical protein
MTVAPLSMQLKICIAVRWSLAMYIALGCIAWLLFVVHQELVEAVAACRSQSLVASSERSRC